MSETRGAGSEGRKADDVQYISHVVKTIRGREASTKVKLENEGWEFVSQTPGKLRTEMTFRRVKPKSLGAFLQRGWANFRCLAPTTQRILMAGVGGLIMLLVVVAVVAARGGDSPEPAAAPSEVAVEPSRTPPEDPTQEPSETPPGEPSERDEILTAVNNKDLAAILVETDNCGDSVTGFAGKYRGRTIEFDGSISAMSNHESYNTRYDIIVSPGDKGSSSTRGPNFQFRDVNLLDLKFTGDVADSVGLNDKLHVVAEVDEFLSSQCLLLIEPVSTQLR